MSQPRVRVLPFNLDGSPQLGAGLVFALPNGTWVGGLAPIGVRWSGTVMRGRIQPARGCPRNEFIVTGADIAGVYFYVEVVP